MSETDRDALAKIMHDAFVAARDRGGWLMIADAILASPWLAQVKATARAEVLRMLASQFRQRGLSEASRIAFDTADAIGGAQ
jgi:hypothetical protein